MHYLTTVLLCLPILICGSSAHAENASKGLTAEDIGTWEEWQKELQRRSDQHHFM